MPRQETTNEDGFPESAAIPEGLQAVMQVKSSQVAPGGSTFRYSMTLALSLLWGCPSSAATRRTEQPPNRGRPATGWTAAVCATLKRLAFIVVCKCDRCNYMAWLNWV
ncbi:hypothetical protein NW757_007027 [Fusarium falciforme]|nr:hypothetical protein NW757_007027 [Fusarium falciforme]